MESHSAILKRQKALPEGTVDYHCLKEMNEERAEMKTTTKEIIERVINMFSPPNEEDDEFLKRVINMLSPPNEEDDEFLKESKALLNQPDDEEDELLEDSKALLNQTDDEEDELLEGKELPLSRFKLMTDSAGPTVQFVLIGQTGMGKNGLLNSNLLRKPSSVNVWNCLMLPRRTKYLHQRIVTWYTLQEKIKNLPFGRYTEMAVSAVPTVRIGRTGAGISSSSIANCLINFDHRQMILGIGTLSERNEKEREENPVELSEMWKIRNTIKEIDKKISSGEEEFRIHIETMEDKIKKIIERIDREEEKITRNFKILEDSKWGGENNRKGKKILGFVEDENTLHDQGPPSKNNCESKLEILKEENKQLDKEMNEILQQCILRLNGMHVQRPTQKRQKATI